MKCAVLTLVLVLVSEATKSTTELTRYTLPRVPQWYFPCHNSEGRSQNQRVTSDENPWARKLIRRLTVVRQQLNVTMEHYKEQLLSDSYKEIQSRVDKLQYVPKWVPGMGNVLMFFGENSSRLQMSGYLPIMHKELQKFAVALEAVIQTDRERAIVSMTNTYLIQFLCELEGALVAQQIGVPAPREQRSLMTEAERNPPDMTQHHIRNWGILTKYRDYVRYWHELLHETEKKRKSRKTKNGQISRTPTA